MKTQDFAELLLLGAVWGASFMLMKEAVPSFGVFALVEVRAIGASIFLLPLVYLKNQQVDLYQYWKPLVFVGLVNTAIPFCLFNYAVSHLDAGLAAILNATAPMFGVLVAWIYLQERVGKWGLVGVALGFVGVIFISLDPNTASDHAWLPSLLPISAALGATFCYAVTASYLKRHLSHVKPFAIAAGSQIATAVILLPAVLMTLPKAMPSYDAWFAALLLAFMCTGFAYVMYFDLIAKIGASKAITVGYLVPLFGIFWGVALLDESLATQQIIGAAFIMLGVTMATNAIGLIHSFRKKKMSE